MSTRRGSYGHRAAEITAQLDKYDNFFANLYHQDNDDEAKSNDDQQIKFLDGTDTNVSPDKTFTLISRDKEVKYSSIKFNLSNLVDEAIYKKINIQVNKFHVMKLKLSKLFFGLILFKYENHLIELIDLVNGLSLEKQGLTDFIHSCANAMNGNYKFVSTKETFLTQYNVLSFIVDYLQVVLINHENDEKILKNASSSQIIAYIADQLSVNIKNTISKNLKILIRIYIECKMKIRNKKKSIRLKNKDISVRDQLRDNLYVQRKIIQSVIFEYPIEVTFTYLHSFYYYYYYITLYLLYLFIL